VRPLLLTLAVLVAVSVCMTVACVGYCVVFPVNMVPGPEDTPMMKANGARYSDGLFWLMLGAMLAWLVTFGAAVGLGVRWLVVRTRTRTEGKA
jgi:hypothetical protein